DSGVTVAQLAEALWPDEPGQADHGPPGGPRRPQVAGHEPAHRHWYLPEATESQRTGGTAVYLVDGVLTDADLFRRLRLRLRARPAARTVSPTWRRPWGC
ncbi:MAG TPA: hypothetical protein VGO94_07115, partial [Mycobacteriales bacterium]|nr:hypothetical protein [Mycobacteriales bacterium]